MIRTPQSRQIAADACAATDREAHHREAHHRNAHPRNALLVTLLLLLASCGGAQPTPADPLVDDMVWSTANARMERHFETTALPETFDVPMEALKYLLEGKIASYNTARDAFIAMYDTNELSVRAAATLRVGQIDLNFGCELAMMEPPSDFGPVERDLVRDTIAQKTAPFFSGSRRHLSQASRMGDGPYARAAMELMSGFPNTSEPAALRSYCAKHQSAWMRKADLPFDARMVRACEAGLASSCYIASLLVKNERLATDYAQRACLDDVPEACGNGGATCEGGDPDACWTEASLVVADNLEDYTRSCYGGSGFDCFRRGLLLEREEELLTDCANGPLPDAESIDGARQKCTDGDVLGCFQLGVATYTTPRELERARDGEGLIPPKLSGSRAERTKACIEDKDRIACAELAEAYRSGGDFPRSTVCAARLLFRACRPGATTWCPLFNRFEK